MSITVNPKIISKGLSFYLDSLNDKSFKGEPTINTVSYNPPFLGIYNNPGFTVTNTKTSEYYKGSPIWQITYSPQATSYIARLGNSGEGFGSYHSMGTILEKAKKYMASIYFKTDYPLLNNVNEGFNNTYSNISGWGYENTTYTRYKEGEWTRLYTKWGCSGSYINRSPYTTTNFIVNTNSTQNVTVSVSITSAMLTDYAYLYAIVSHSPSIANNAGLTGLTIVNHGLDTNNWTKLSYPSNIKLKSQIPYTYYFLLSVPSTGGVNKTISIRPYPNEYVDATSDSKFWKISFNTSNLKANDVIKTYWTCPMMEETTGTYPSTFVIGTRGMTVDSSGGIIDLSPNKNIGTIVNDITFNAGTEGGLIFNGIDNAIKFTYNKTDLNANPVFSVGAFIKRTGRVTNGGYWGFGGDASSAGISCYTLTDNKISINLSNVATFSTNIDYPLNKYVHVVWVKRSGQFNTTNISIFINGIEYTGSKLIIIKGNTHTPNLNTSTKGIILGSSSTESSSYYVPGVISLFRIYSKILTLSEILQNYNAYRSRFSLPPI